MGVLQEIHKDAPLDPARYSRELHLFLPNEHAAEDGCMDGQRQTPSILGDLVSYQTLGQFTADYKGFLIPTCFNNSNIFESPTLQ